MTRMFSAFNAFLYSSFAYLYFFNAGLTPIRPVYWYLFTIVGALSLGLYRHRIGLSTPSARQLVLWALSFLATCGFGFAWSSQSAVATQALITACEAMIMLIAFLYLFGERSASESALRAVLVSTFLGVILNIVEYLLPSLWQFTTVPGRAAGLYENANISGCYLVFGMVLAVSRVPRSWRLLYCFAIGFAVLLTFSRSALLAWAIAVVMLSWYRLILVSRSRGVLVVGGLIASVAIAIGVGEMTGVLGAVGLGDRLTANTIARLTGSFFGLSDDSSVGRLFVAKAGLMVFLDAPFMGHGIGVTNEWRAGGGTHNLYIRMAAELGSLGLALVVWLIAILWRDRKPLSRIFTTVFVVTALFTHTILDEPAMMLMMALAVMADSERVTQGAGLRRYASSFVAGSASSRT